MTSDGGVLLLRASDQRLKLTERVADQMLDSRDPDRIQHQLVDLLRQRVYGLACGYEDLNDLEKKSFRHDLGNKKAPLSRGFIKFIP